MIKEILQMVLGAILMACGLGLSVKYLNGLMLIGIALIVIGMILLVHTTLK